MTGLRNPLLALSARVILYHSEMMEKIMADLSNLRAAVSDLEQIVNTLKANAANAEAEKQAAVAAALAAADAQTQADVDTVVNEIRSFIGN